jgi:signal transduction histidine kinase
MRARLGVRVASALSAAAVVAIALIIGGAALVYLVGHSLNNTVRDTAQDRATQIAVRMHGNYGKRDPVTKEFTPKENAVEALDTLAKSPDDLAQILVDYSDDQDGTSYVLQSDTAAAGEVPMSDLTPAPGQTVAVDEATVTLANGRPTHVALVATGVTGTTNDPKNAVVLFAVPLTAVDAAVDTLLFYLLFGVPILIVVAGAATYLFAGRALRPVEAIREQVAAMTEKDLAQRVPVPASRDEVSRLAETMNAMISRLEDAQGVQRRFVADASHELRSPLATIAAGLELMQSGSSDAATVAAMRGETERLGRLIDALLLLARADERGLQPRREEVDLDEIAEAEQGRPADGGAHIEVHAEPVRVIGDRSQLVRVLRNLVDNAHRHARSQVLVTVVRQGDFAVVEVADDGPGVPAAERARVFERFVRLDDARARADGGSGLGLAIVAEVVAAHGGDVELEESALGGALFRVRVPAVPGDRAPDSEPFAAVAPADADLTTDPPAADSAAGPVAEPAAAAPAAAAPAPAERRLPAPVRDEDARRDPVTAPWGIPAVPAPDRPVPSGVGPSGQPGSTIR